MATLATTTTTAAGPEWITIAECARRLGEHRQQLSRMIHDTGTFPLAHLDRTGPRVLIRWAPDRARKVQGSKRGRFSG
jgi:hypothetical protein